MARRWGHGGVKNAAGTLSKMSSAETCKNPSRRQKLGRGGGGGGNGKGGGGGVRNGGKFSRIERIGPVR